MKRWSRYRPSKREQHAMRKAGHRATRPVRLPSGETIAESLARAWEQLGKGKRRAIIEPA